MVGITDADLRKPTQMVNPKSAEQTQVFSDRLTGSRHARGLTQAELAEKSGVSLRSVQNWEGGESGTPRPALLRNLAAVLRVTPEYLLGQSITYESPPPFIEGVSSAIPNPPPMPPWMADLADRLQSHDEPRRRRLLAIIHSILDVIEPPEQRNEGAQVSSHPEDRFAPHPDPEVQAAVEAEERAALASVLRSSGKKRSHKD